MNSKDINRREFLRRLGLGGAAVTAAAVTGCSTPGKGTEDTASANTPLEEGKMTYRTNPKSGEKVSLLGYGCMR